MMVEKLGTASGGFPSPMVAHTERAAAGRNVRILLLDDDAAELEKLQNALAAGHREISLVQARSVEAGFKAFDKHDLVITDRQLNPVGVGWEGVELTARIKSVRPETVVIINSAFPPVLEGKSDLEPDYVHVKGMGTVIKKGEHKSLIPTGGIIRGYENLNKLVGEIERDRFKMTH